MTQDPVIAPQDADAIDKEQILAAIPDDAEIPQEAFEKLSQDELEALFIEQLITDKGLEPNDVLRAQLKERMNERVNKSIASKLPAEIAERLEAQDEVTEDDLDKAIEEAGLDVAKITEDAMLAFRVNYLKEEA